MLRDHALITGSLRALRNHATPKPSPCLIGKRWASKAPARDDGDGTSTVNRRRASKVQNDAAADGGQDDAPKKKRGRPPKTPVIAYDRPASATTSAENAVSSPRRRRASTKSQSDLPPRLTALASGHHYNLTTFLRHAQQKKLNPTSNVYKGTHYEYTCIRTLSSRRYNFQLHRTGRANDLGIDLLGWWKLPDRSPTSTDGERGQDDKEGDGSEQEGSKRRRRVWRRLKVLAQCKALAPKPAMVRELEGAYVGAPAGWSSSLTPANTSDTSAPTPALALLISTGAATKGVLAALQRSRWPMGSLQITREGEVKQFLWNAVAADRCGLEGLGVVVRYSERKGKEKGTGEGEKDGGVRQGVRLTWMGRVWRA